MFFGFYTYRSFLKCLHSYELTIHLSQNVRIDLISFSRLIYQPWTLLLKIRINLKSNPINVLCWISSRLTGRQLMAKTPCKKRQACICNWSWTEEIHGLLGVPPFYSVAEYINIQIPISPYLHMYLLWILYLLRNLRQSFSSPINLREKVPHLRTQVQREMRGQGRGGESRQLQLWL